MFEWLFGNGGGAAGGGDKRPPPPNTAEVIDVLSSGTDKVVVSALLLPKCVMLHSSVLTPSRHQTH